MSRRARILLALALLALIAVVALWWLAQPRQVAAILLNRLGATLDLTITARGVTEYHLRGAPVLVLRDVEARQPGAKTALLTARRLYVSLPWSTVRAAGRDLTVKRIELDAPRIDLPALQHWLDTRPPSVPKLPTLTDGVRVNDGEMIAAGWRLAGIQLDIPRLHATQPLQARLKARYLAPPLTVPMDLALALSRPEILVKPMGSGFGAVGSVSVDHAQDWRIPTTLRASGPLLRRPSDWRVLPLNLGVAGSYRSGDSDLPFAVGAHGPLVIDDALRLAPAAFALRGRDDPETDVLPTADARGTLALGERLDLQLDGVIAQWPQSWPALPPPLGQSRSSLPFVLDYHGATAFTDPVNLQLRRDATRFQGRFRVPEMLAWVDTAATGTPLPPLTGTLVTPRIEISGAVLDGVEVEFDDSAAQP